MLIINVNINLHGTVKMSEAVTDVTSCIVLLIFFRLVHIKRIRQSVYLFHRTCLQVTLQTSRSFLNLSFSHDLK